MGVLVLTELGCGSKGYGRSLHSRLSLQLAQWAEGIAGFCVQPGTAGKVKLQELIFGEFTTTGLDRRQNSQP